MNTTYPTIWWDIHGEGGFPPAREPGDIFINADGEHYRFTEDLQWVRLGARDTPTTDDAANE